MRIDTLVFTAFALLTFGCQPASKQSVAFSCKDYENAQQGRETVFNGEISFVSDGRHFVWVSKIDACKFSNPIVVRKMPVVPFKQSVVARSIETQEKGKKLMSHGSGNIWCHTGSFEEDQQCYIDIVEMNELLEK